MDFLLDPQYEDLIESAKTLAREALAPRASEYDREAKFPRENFEDLTREGFTRITLPEALGGREVLRDPVSFASILYELGKACASTALLFHQHCTIVHFLCELGNAEQVARYAETVRAGKIFATHGSESASSQHGRMLMETRATLEEDVYRINGCKYFLSMGGEADCYVLWCQLEEEEDLTKSLCLFVTPSDAPGLVMDKEWDAFAMRPTASHSMIYKNVAVPVCDRVGEGGDPLRPDLISLFGYGYAVVYLASAGGAFDWAVNYAKNRVLKPDNLPIAVHPPIRRHIAEMKVALETARVMLQRAGWLIGTKKGPTAYAAVHEAKYAAVEAAAAITDRALKVAGGSGILRDHPLERFHRETRAGLVMPPNPEKCLEIAAKTVLEGKAGTLYA